MDYPPPCFRPRFATNLCHKRALIIHGLSIAFGRESLRLEDPRYTRLTFAIPPPTQPLQPQTTPQPPHPTPRSPDRPLRPDPARPCPIPYSTHYHCPHPLY